MKKTMLRSFLAAFIAILLLINSCISVAETIVQQTGNNDAEITRASHYGLHPEDALQSMVQSLSA